MHGIHEVLLSLAALLGRPHELVRLRLTISKKQSSKGTRRWPTLLDTDLWIDRQGLERCHLHRQPQKQVSEETSDGAYVFVNARNKINGVEEIESVPSSQSQRKWPGVKELWSFDEQKALVFG